MHITAMHNRACCQVQLEIEKFHWSCFILSTTPPGMLLQLFTTFAVPLQWFTSIQNSTKVESIKATKQRVLECFWKQVVAKRNFRLADKAMWLSQYAQVRQRSLSHCPVTDIPPRLLQWVELHPRCMKFCEELWATKSTAFRHLDPRQ